MEKIRIKVSSSAEKSLKKIPRTFAEKILLAIENLALNPLPQGVRKLQGEDHVYRIRVGTYRVIYEFVDRKVFILVLKIAHRKEFYR